MIADLPAEALLTAVDAGRAEGMLVLNVRASDDRLRNEDCRGNVLHTVPSRAMLTDGLAQYLVLKRWIRWFLVVGQNEGDDLLADALCWSARRLGAKIVVDKTWSFRFSHGRADTGSTTLQTEIPVFTRVADHDVLVVADEADALGEYLPSHTALPRPVVGAHGMLATAWSPLRNDTVIKSIPTGGRRGAW